jgi:hypothetical protein
MQQHKEIQNITQQSLKINPIYLETYFSSDII